MFSLPLLLIAYLGFVSLSLPDVVIGVAWPSLRDEFGRAQSGLGTILLCFGAGYLVSSLLAGGLIRRLGIGRLLTLSTAAVSAALLIYALTPLWFGVLGGALLLGLGSGAIDTGLNAYGARHFSPRQMNWLHASWGLGAMLGPLLMTAVLAGGASWRWGYALTALPLLLMTALFAVSRRRWRDPEPDQATARPGKGALKNPLVWLQVALFYVYTGLEASAGHWSFTYYTEGRGAGLASAGLWVSLYWGSLTAGRVAFGVLVERLGTRRVLRGASAAALCGALLVMTPSQALSVAGLLLLGFALAPFFPCLIADTPRRLGALAEQAIGLQIAAALIGGSTVPAVIGWLTRLLPLTLIGPALLVLTLLLAGLCALLLRVAPVADRDGS